MNVALCSKLFTKFCKWEEKEREDVHPDWGGNLNLGPLEWQPIVLTNAPCLTGHMVSIGSHFPFISS